MGEAQKEIDKRLLRDKIVALKRELDAVRAHRQQYRDRRHSAPAPVVALVGYTNAGKSTLLNALSGAEVFAEDLLFATLDPTTRRAQLGGGQARMRAGRAYLYVPTCPWMDGSLTLLGATHAAGFSLDT